MSHLLEFYGEECEYCQAMRPLVECVEKEARVTVDRFEIWHNDKNRKMMDTYDKQNCGGVPFFYNKKSKRWICGEATYEELLAWASGR